MVIHSPFEAAFVAGTRFVDDRGRIATMSTRGVGELKVPSGQLIVADPFTTSFATPGRALSRTAPVGVFPVEVAIAHFENDQRVACARIQFDYSRESAVRWEVARFADEESRDEDEAQGYGVDAGMGCFFDRRACAELDESVTEEWLAATERNGVDTWTWHVANVGEANVVMFSSGWGDGVYLSYWGFDQEDRLVELVTDFEVLLGPSSERFEVPLPLPRGRFKHPLLEKHDVTLERPFLSSTTAILAGRGSARVELTDGTSVHMRSEGLRRRYTWSNAAKDARLVICVMTGVKPLDVVEP